VKVVCPITAKSFEANRLNTIPVNADLLRAILFYFNATKEHLTGLYLDLEDEKKKEIAALQFKVDDKNNFLTMLHVSIPRMDEFLERLHNPEPAESDDTDPNEKTDP
jgi:hypothetical protein